MKALALLLLALPAAADPVAGGPTIHGVFNPVVGLWAAYDFTANVGAKGKQSGRYKVAVVEQEGSDVWLEQTLTLAASKDGVPQSTAVRMLVAQDVSRPKKVLIQFGGKLVDASAMFGAAMKDSDGTEAAMQELEVSTLSLTAGDFETIHRRSADGSVEDWIKEGIGPFGVVKQIARKKSTDGSMSLAAYGFDATPEIKGVLENGGPGVGDDAGAATEKMLQQALDAIKKRPGMPAVDAGNMEPALDKAMEGAAASGDPLDTAAQIEGKKKKK